MLLSRRFREIGLVALAAAVPAARGLRSTNGDRVPWQMEGGKGTKPRVVHVEVRPHPLAK